jgi:hypothetical protein
MSDIMVHYAHPEYVKNHQTFHPVTLCEKSQGDMDEEDITHYLMPKENLFSVYVAASWIFELSAYMNDSAKCEICMLLHFQQMAEENEKDLP